MSRKTTKRKSYSKQDRKSGVLKPVMIFLLMLVIVGLAFYLGTKYGDFQNRAAKELTTSSLPATEPDNTDEPENTGMPDTISNVSVTEPTAQNELITLTLYYPNANYDSVVPYKREVRIEKGESAEKVIFNELKKGPQGTGKNPVIPEGSELISVETRDGICYLNLTSEFVDNNPGGTAFELILINSIVNSLTELPYVKKVQFLIEGEKREIYSHAIFDEPFERNESFITTAENTLEAIEQKIRELGEKTLKALSNGDMEWISDIVHPKKGLRFSPYTYVDLEKDLTFSAEEIKGIMENDTVYTWGYYDGSGEPIKLTFTEYLSQFVYDKDFLNAEEIGYNRYIAQGNTINNIFEAYPDGKMIEYHFPGFEPQYEGMDWASLKLVFEELEGEWYLAGIVHDQWTI